jgi:hypothetical protein
MWRLTGENIDVTFVLDRVARPPVFPGWGDFEPLPLAAS